MDGIIVVLWMLSGFALSVAILEIVRLNRVNRDLVAQAIILARHGGIPAMVDPKTGDIQPIEKPHPNFPFTDQTRSYRDEHS